LKKVHAQVRYLREQSNIHSIKIYLEVVVICGGCGEFSWEGSIREAFPDIPSLIDEAEEDGSGFGDFDKIMIEELGRRGTVVWIL
jgi:hypothetical protein